VAPLGRGTGRIPERILSGTGTLVENALLQNAGVHRREAIDTLAAGGWSEQVSRAFRRVLEHKESEPWFRCRALFAVSFLQDREPRIDTILRQAYKAAKANLESGSEPTRGMISEMHAVLFAIGDVFGATGAENQAGQVRRFLNGSLKDLLNATYSNPDLYRVARAIGYLVMVTAQTRDGTSRQMLESLQDHPDEATRNLGEWALEHRFDGDEVRPLHEAR
jgi:hypothetical protein